MPHAFAFFLTCYCHPLSASIAPDNARARLSPCPPLGEPRLLHLSPKTVASTWNGDDAPVSAAAATHTREGPSEASALGQPH
jgi:hypothetical protein